MIDLDLEALGYEFWATRRDPRVSISLIDAMPKGSPRILDAGCGSGRLALQMARRAEFVTGLDLSATRLASARARQAEMDLHNIFWVQGNLANLPFHSYSFDYVVCTSVLKFTVLGCVLPELKRMVKPGGRLALRDVIPPSSHLQFKLDQLRHLMRFALQLYEKHGARIAWRYTAARLRNLPAFEKTWYASLTPSTFREQCSQILPGCLFKQGSDLMMLWENS